MEKADQEIQHQCLNCNTILPESAIYCPRCGQKDKDTRVSFLKIVGEAITHLLNLEAALFRTLPNLLIPGKLTLEFFKGKQKRYMNPVRLFLWVSVILAALLTFRTNDTKIVQGMDFFDQYKESWHLKKALVPLDTAMEKTQEIFADQSLEPVFDSLRVQYLHSIPQKDSLNLNEEFDLFGGASLVISVKDLYELSADSLINKYQVNGFWNRIVTKQKVKFLLDQKSFGSAMIGKITWALFFLLPMLAFGLKLIYIRRGFYYVEHLILGMHVHTFGFILLIGYLIADPYIQTDENQLIALLVITIVIGLYVLLAQKLYYRQGWIKTILKFILVQSYYFILLAIAFLLTMLIGFFLF